MLRGKLRIGRVSYTNTLPLFYHLPKRNLDVVEGTPRKLASLLSVGLLDGGIISSVFYLRREREFVLLPDVSISSFGPSGSVLLFSKKPLKEIRSFKPSGESLTSNLIAYTTLKRLYGLKVEPSDQHFDAELVIGDRALKMAKRRPYPFVYDVGELWFEKTNLPAVFALFIVSSRVFTEHLSAVSKLAVDLLESKRRFFRNLENLPIGRETKEYLRNLNYDFGREHLQSLELLKKFLSEDRVI